jgi:hypothetical protein
MKNEKKNRNNNHYKSEKRNNTKNTPFFRFRQREIEKLQKRKRRDKVWGRDNMYYYHVK